MSNFSILVTRIPKFILDVSSTIVFEVPDTYIMLLQVTVVQLSDFSVSGVI